MILEALRNEIKNHIFRRGYFLGDGSFKNERRTYSNFKVPGDEVRQ